MFLSPRSRAVVLGALALSAFAVRPRPARAEAPSSNAPATYFHYRRLIFAESIQELAKIKPAPGAGPIVVHGVSVLETKEFKNDFLRYIGRVITTQSVNEIAQAVVAYAKSHDRVVVNVLIPNQDISGGDFRMAVVIGRYSQLKFKNNHWFSDRQLERDLGVKPGDEIRLSVLEAAVNWTNANPFRHVEVLVNTINKDPGMADLDVAVMEHFPMRFAFTYDDTGTDLIGNNHYTGLVQFGNLWGRDHQVSYQYTTTDDAKVYQAHSLDYRIPLPWRHYLVFDLAYAQIRPSFSFEGATFNLTGRNFVGDARYVIPFDSGGWKFEFATGVDFKRSNNNLLYGGFQVQQSSTDVAQFTESLSTARPDRHGAWAFALNVDYSPGHFDSADTDAAYGNSRFGAQARYVYGTFVAQRRYDLPFGFQSFSKAIGQLSSANLLSSEELLIGGQATVRGYNELVYSGDQGVVLSEELQGPTWQKHLPFLPKNSAPFLLRPLAFVDYGRVYYKHLAGGDITLSPLMSAGVGLRANLASNFTLSADYGWQLLETAIPQPNHCRGHIKVTIAY